MIRFTIGLPMVAAGFYGILQSSGPDYTGLGRYVVLLLCGLALIIDLAMDKS